MLGGDEGKPSSSGVSGAEASEPPKLPVTSRALRRNVGNDVDESDKASEASELSPLRGAETPGSRRHGVECDPCAWYWKPQGCMRGSECGYCHLCPEGEVKLRKKAKVAAMKGVASPTSTTSSLSPTKFQKKEADLEVPDRQPSMSVGAALHGTGECKPCAWFWKPKGCQNGEECRHCHLCPLGEIRQRKKMKDRLAREGGYSQEDLMMPMEPLKVEIPGAAGIAPTFEPLKCEEPQKVAPSPTWQPTDAAIAPPPGLADLAWQESLEQEIASSPLALSLAQMLEEEDANYQVDINPFMMGTESADAAHVFPSEGSKLHGTGFCRPCAWFWKPKGCDNGMDCRHCHLCPQEEIKNRRKAKQMMQNDPGSPRMWGGTSWTPLSAMDSMMTQTPASMFLGSEFSDPTVLTPLELGTSPIQSSNFDAQWDPFGALSPVSPESPKLAIDLASCLPVPSACSALHGTVRIADSRNPRTVRIAPLLAG